MRLKPLRKHLKLPKQPEQLLNPKRVNIKQNIEHTKQKWQGTQCYSKWVQNTKISQHLHQLPGVSKFKG